MPYPSPKLAKQNTHEMGGVAPISLGAAAVTRHGDTGCVDYLGLDAAGTQPEGQPKAVSSRFIGNHDARDHPTGGNSFLALAFQQTHQTVLVWLELFRGRPYRSRLLSHSRSRL